MVIWTEGRTNNGKIPGQPGNIEAPIIWGKRLLKPALLFITISGRRSSTANGLEEPKLHTITEFHPPWTVCNPLHQTPLCDVPGDLHSDNNTGTWWCCLVIRADSHLHTPMYFFRPPLFRWYVLFNHRCPRCWRNLHICQGRKNRYSGWGCLAQVFFVLLPGTEACLLSVACQAAVAICHPLLLWTDHGQTAVYMRLCGAPGPGLSGPCSSTSSSCMNTWSSVRPKSPATAVGNASLSHNISDVSETSFAPILFLCHGLSLPFGLLSYACIIPTSSEHHVLPQTQKQGFFSTCSSHSLPWHCTGSVLSISAILIQDPCRNWSSLCNILSSRPCQIPSFYSQKKQGVEVALKRTLEKYCGISDAEMKI